MVTWREAWEAANLSFYSTQHPDSHFRTSAAYADVLAPAIAHFVEGGLPAPREHLDIEVVDVGAADAALGTYVAQELAARGWQSRTRSFDLRPGPAVTVGVVPQALKHSYAHRSTQTFGVVLAHEFLDDVPCERIVIDDTGSPRLLLAEGGSTIIGPRLNDPVCARWGIDVRGLVTWWQKWAPCTTPGVVIDIGDARDAAWCAMLTYFDRGLALAVDYAISRADRTDRGTTVTSYREGRRVPVTLDGSANITAHVAFDALAAAGSRHARTTVLRRQRECIPAPGSSRDPLVDLARASRAATLRDPAGLGAFRWLAQWR
jgi:hypothetical protein